VWQRAHAGMCAQLAPRDEEVERNRRLVRYWDGLSHDLLCRRWPCVRRSVPAAGGAQREIRLAADAERLTLDPWPLRSEHARVSVTGRLLRDRYSDVEALRAALADGPEIELAFDLEPA
jgi:Protein of unknown function (DUF3891)